MARITWKETKVRFGKWVVAVLGVAASVCTVIAFLSERPLIASFFAGLALGLVPAAYLLLIRPSIGDGEPNGNAGDGKPAENPIDRTIDVTVDAPHFKQAPLKLAVITRNYDGTKARTKVRLSWPTFMNGARTLCEHMNELPRWTPIDACIGVNTGGVVLADYISKNCQVPVPRDRLGVFQTQTPQKPEHKGGKPRRGIVFPQLGPQRYGRILVVDSELKSGYTLTDVCDYLKTEHECHSIWYLALVACGVDADTESTRLTELLMYYRRGQRVVKRKLPAFDVSCWVAYITPMEAVKLPDGVY